MTSLKTSVQMRAKKEAIKDRKLPPDEFMAAAVGDIKWLHYSLRDGHDPSTFDKHGLAPLHVAAMYGRLECLKVLIQTYNVDVNLQSEDGFTALHMAINKNNEMVAYDCIKYLIEQGAELDLQTRDGQTPVHKAASEGMADCLTLLIDEGAELELVDSRSDSALDLARLWGKRKCARILQNKIWENTKVYDELVKLKSKKMHQEFVDMQRDVLHQLLNEQEFFGNLSYVNWLEFKGYSGEVSQVNTYMNKKYSQNLMGGLISRLFSTGTIKEIASRMEKLLQAYVKAAELKAIAYSQIGNEMGIGSKSSLRVGKRQKKGKSKLNTYKSAFESFSDLSDDQDDRFQPVGIYAVPRVSQLQYVEVSRGNFKWMAPWNSSTNVKTFPITDLKNVQSVPISIKPDVDDDLPILPSLSRISFDIEKRIDRILLKLSDSSGDLEVVDVAVPLLSRRFLETSFFDNLKKRKPKEIASGRVHIFDIQRKRRPQEPPATEIVKHMKAAVDGYLFGNTTAFKKIHK